MHGLQLAGLWSSSRRMVIHRPVYTAKDIATLCARTSRSHPTWAPPMVTA
jgi:hypothetical protein